MLDAEFKVSIGRNYISEIELNKEKRVSFEVVWAMAGVLKVSMDFLAMFSEDPSPMQQRESGITYFSEEADEVAQLVDKMRPDQRSIVLSVARGLLPPQLKAYPPSDVATNNIAGWRAASEVLEERFGPSGAEEYLALLEERSPDIAAALRLSAPKKKLVENG